MDIKETVYYASTIILLVILMFMIIFSDNGFLDMRKLKGLLSDVRVTNMQVCEKNKSLCRKINRLRSDLEYVEYIARNDMGMVGENDMVILFDDARPGNRKNRKE